MRIKFRLQWHPTQQAVKATSDTRVHDPDIYLRTIRLRRASWLNQFLPEMWPFSLNLMATSESSAASRHTPQAEKNPIKRSQAHEA